MLAITVEVQLFKGLVIRPPSAAVRESTLRCFKYNTELRALGVEAPSLKIGRTVALEKQPLLVNTAKIF